MAELSRFRNLSGTASVELIVYTRLKAIVSFETVFYLPKQTNPGRTKRMNVTRYRAGCFPVDETHNMSDVKVLFRLSGLPDE